ncbi:MAG: anthranilate synthase component I family protein [Methanospirillum sp.]|nr:anthranilate synthase component I family protein [Methanospirillum sp.]
MEVAMTGNRVRQVMSFQDYEKIARSYEKRAYIPVQMIIPEPRVDPASIYADMSPAEGFLLESMEGVPRRAVRSIIGIKPLAVLSIGENLHVTGEKAGFFQEMAVLQRPGAPLEILKQISGNISGYSLDERSFTGGMAGYCRYELVRSITHGMVTPGDDDSPVIRFIVPGEIVVFDHVTHTCTLIAGTLVHPGEDLHGIYQDAVERVRSLHETISRIPEGADDPVLIKEAVCLPHEDRGSFEQAVAEALEHIRAGDIFQVVLSRRFSLPFQDDPYKIYRILRLINPSPYLYYFNFGDETVIGSSPEMLVKTEGSVVTTVPIAGTRPRGRDKEEDEKLAADLLADPKELAEHLMLVDLARNDIGKVSEFGTVRVTDFMEIEKFSHVQHITSVVVGDLKHGLSPVDALEACFPAGTVSGAPKIRAMQIISELEPVSRGLYSGAVGYLGFNGLMEFAIAIRTVIVRDGMATCQAGAGIVADSVPSREFEETEAKVRAMAQAVYGAGVSE